jgi:hypothetical protein
MIADRHCDIAIVFVDDNTAIGVEHPPGTRLYDKAPRQACLVSIPRPIDKNTNLIVLDQKVPLKCGAGGHGPVVPK